MDSVLFSLPLSQSRIATDCLPHSITLATAAGAMAGVGVHRYVIEREAMGES